MDTPLTFKLKLTFTLHTLKKRRLRSSPVPIKVRQITIGAKVREILARYPTENEKDLFCIKSNKKEASVKN